jgi:hypothetical protein
LIASLKDWRGWIWPLVAGGLVLAITFAGVVTAPEKSETWAQKHPPKYIKLAALAAARENGDPEPAAIEWIVTTHAAASDALGIEDVRPDYKRDVLVLVQGEFRTSPGVPPASPGDQRSSWLALLYTAGKTHRQLALGAYAQRPDTSGLSALKRFEW